jgi:ABC-type lipoprotein release transport system permease subunit
VIGYHFAAIEMVVGVVLALVVACMAVSGAARRAARLNPVEALAGE